MTRDEHRAKCVKAMYNAIPGVLHVISIKDMYAAFDSLHGIALVDPTEATEEMIMAGLQASWASKEDQLLMWRAMSAVGDLTNPPKGKP